MLVSSGSEKFPVFLVLPDLFISKIAGCNQECLLPRYFSRFDILFKTEFFHEF